MENLKMDKIGGQLKEFLKTENEWIAHYNRLVLPPFEMGKEKHNNRTKTNVRGSSLTKFKSLGRKRRVPQYYICEFNTEEECRKLQNKLRDLGIAAQSQKYSSGKIEIMLPLADANRVVSSNYYHKKMILK